MLGPAKRTPISDPDLGFMARMLTLCSLPRTNPGDRLQYVRQNGPYSLVMIAGGRNKLPFGNLPRLLLSWVCTEAVRTRNRELILGSSLSGFMREIGLDSSSGVGRRRLRMQMDRLFHAQVEMIYEDQLARWYNLASAQGNEQARDIKDDLRTRMTPDQIAQAQEMSATLFDRIN